MITEKKSITLQDVAAAAGVSKAAVSQALSGKGRLSSERRRAILDLARDMQFEANPHAQRLSRGSLVNTIGLFSLGIDSGVATQKIQIIQHLLSQRGFDVPLYAYGAHGSGEIVNQVELIRTLRQSRPRAIVCKTGALEAGAEAELKEYIHRGGVVVCYDSPTTVPCDQVVFDRTHNTYWATRYLLEKGHRDLGLYMNGNLKPHGDRLKGFLQALQEFGGRSRDDWMFWGMAENGGEAMAARFLKMKRRPTGICVINDSAALAFMSEVRQAGVRVPEDVSVVGHDDLPIAKHGVVPLTTMSHPVETIAYQVVDMICSRVEERYSGPPRQVVVRGGLVERQSATRIGVVGLDQVGVDQNANTPMANSNGYHSTAASPVLFPGRTLL